MLRVHTNYTAARNGYEQITVNILNVVIIVLTLTNSIASQHIFKLVVKFRRNGQ